MEFLLPRFSDLIDILVISFLVYQSLLILKKNASLNMMYGFLLLIAVYILSLILKLNLVHGILNSIKNLWILIIIVLFQNEIRELLSKVKFTTSTLIGNKKNNIQDYSSVLIDAISAMSFRRTGAIIVIEKRQELVDYINAGELIDSLISLRLILTMFNTKTVLHDGAIIIRENRILAAKVVLPLSKNTEYKQRFGTRHLAAIGITELSDATAIVVSEQSGNVSVARQGAIQTDVAFEELMQIITDAAK